MDEGPEEVLAPGGRLIDVTPMKELDDFDTAVFNLRAAGGKQRRVHNSRTPAYGHDRRGELLGTTGRVTSGNRKPHAVTHFPASHTERAMPYLNFLVERYREAFDAGLGTFVEAVEKGVADEVGFEDGRRALILAEGRTVKVSEVG